MVTFIIAVVIATVVPSAFLYFMRRLDLYGTGAFRTVMMCFFWGVAAFLIALGINNAMLDNNIVSQDIFRWFSAPIVEEILKSLLLIYLVRRVSFTYFVDGAIYGFACGIGFAIAENFYYLYFHQNTAIGLAVARVLSTNLIHASASALIGIQLGRSRFSKFPGLLLVAGVGYALAMALHIGYNNLVTRISSGLLLLYAASVGFGAAAIIYFTIRRGLAEEKDWIEETIGQETSITSGESALVNQLDKSRKLLAPLARRFGQKKVDQISRFLMLQAQLSIKRKTLEKLADDRLKRDVEVEMDQIRAEMNDLRRGLGTYIMIYVRTIFPENSSPLYNRLENILSERAQQPATGGPNAFTLLGSRVSMTAPRPNPNEPGDPNG